MGFLSSLFGSSKSKPATTTNIVQQKLAPEIAPFATEVLEDAQALYKSQMEQGYDPYTGQTIAPFTPEQERAMAGIAGLVGTSRPLQEEALETYRRGGDQFTPEVAQQFMSPYQQAVTDIEKRKAQENFEANVMPAFEAQAISQGGGPGGLGTRAGIQAAELQRGQSQLLADIQAKGSQRAYDDARKGFEQQQARQRQMAGDVAGLGPAMIATGLQEQGALQSVGEQKQQLGQSVMDESYFKFLEEQQFPQQQLANYSGFVYGNPAAGLVNQTGSGTRTAYQPSFGQNILGIGSMLGSAALRNPNMFAAPKATGATGGGIAGLVERQTGNQVGEGDQEALGAYYPGVTGKFDLNKLKGMLSNLGKFASRNAPATEEPLFSYSVPTGSPSLEEMSTGDSDYETVMSIKQDALRKSRGKEEQSSAELENQLKELDQEDKDIGLKPLTTKKVIQSLAGPSTPKALTNKQSAALDEKEAGKIYDNNPTAFGDLTRKQYLADTKAQNEKYLAFVNKMYPEGQNEFLADALAALGSMFIAENKGEAFQKTFSELQAAGVKRRDARRIAIGKVGLENLKRDDATLEKIRMLPKKRREAIEKILAKKYGAEKRDIEKRKTEAQIKKDEAMAKKLIADSKKVPTKTAVAPRNVSTEDKSLASDLFKRPSFVQGALSKYNIPSTVLQKTGVTNTEQVKELIDLTLKEDSVQRQIVSRAKTIQAQKGGKGGISLGFEQALEAATSLVLQDLYDSGRITFDDGVFYNSIKGLDE